MPQLGEAVEPVRVDSVTPWWRSVDRGGSAPASPLRWPRTAAWPLD
jgi:hypothetical protein